MTQEELRDLLKERTQKEKQIYIHQDLEMAAINEEAFKARNVGTLQAFWVLLDIMDQKEVDQHFLDSN